MKFKREAWRALNPPPVHEGEYEVKLDSGEVIRVAYQQQQWTQDTGRFTAWRGRQLKGMQKPKRHRRALDRFRAQAPDTHARAAAAAHFLARRAVSLDKPLPAYQYYLILQALDPARIDEVDSTWIAHMLAQPTSSKEKLEACQNNVLAFFNARGARTTHD